MYSNFTGRAKEAMTLAEKEARESSRAQIESVDVLLGLLQVTDGVAAHILHQRRVGLPRVRDEIEKLWPVKFQLISAGPVPLAPSTKLVVQHAHVECRGINDYSIGTEHLLLGLLSDAGEMATWVLIRCGLTLGGIRHAIYDLLARQVKMEFKYASFENVDLPPEFEGLNLDGLP